MTVGRIISPVVCVDFEIDRLTDASELHDGVASLEHLESLFIVGQVCGDKGKVWVVAELGVFFGDLVDSDDGVACLEGPHDDALANGAVASSHCNLHRVSWGRSRGIP